jgi:hypothetical protein
MLNEDFRAGGPYLCSLPALNFPASQGHPAQIKWGQDFINEIIKILNRHSVAWMDIVLRSRRSERYQDTGPTETVLISATKAQRDKSWLRTCLEIRSLFLGYGLDTLNVEIIDNRANTEFFTFPTFPEDKIHSLWNDLSLRICELIRLEGWLSLECFRRGPSPDRLQNSPTVLLTVPRDSIKDWKPARDEIIALLNAVNLQDVAVEILRSHIWQAANVDLTGVVLPDNAWEKEAQLGMSIGPRNLDYSGSTFGGFIKALSPDDKWRKFGLTCYHCIELEYKEGDNSDLNKGELLQCTYYSSFTGRQRLPVHVYNDMGPPIYCSRAL